MNDMIRMFAKIALQMVIWVFVLSVSWSGQTLYERAHSVLVDNSIVAAIDSELANLWDRLAETARMAFAKETTDETESM